MGGVQGRYFREFSMVLAFAITVSTLVSLTLTPMICARWTPAVPRPRNWFDRLVEGALAKLLAFYARTLRIALRHRLATMIVFAATLVATVQLYIVTPKGFFPQDDTGLVFGFTEASTDVSFPAMAEMQQRAADIVMADPDVAASDRPWAAAAGAARSIPGACGSASSLRRCASSPRSRWWSGCASRSPRWPGSRCGCRPCRTCVSERAAAVRRFSSRCGGGPRAPAEYGPAGRGEAEGAAGPCRCEHRFPAQRVAGQRHHRPADGRAARRAHAGHQQRAEQCFRTAADLDRLHAAQPVSRGAGGDRRISAATRRTSTRSTSTAPTASRCRFPPWRRWSARWPRCRSITRGNSPPSRSPMPCGPASPWTRRPSLCARR